MKNQAEARPAIMPSITASGVESTSEVSPAVNPLTNLNSRSVSCIF